MKHLAVPFAALLGVCGPLSAQVPDLYDPDTVRDLYLTFSQPNWWTLLEQNNASETNIPADMRIDGRLLPTVGVRFRGNTSYSWLPPGSQKKSFNIETDWMVPGQDIYGYDHLNLNNGFHDPLFLREFLAYYIMRRHGTAPKCNFMRLWLNGEYWGIYINVQQPNKDMMKEWFRSNDGNRYRGFPTSGTFGNGRCAMTWLGSTVSAYLSAYQAKQGDGTDLMQLCNVLNNTASAQLPTALPPWFNVDQFLRYAAVMNVSTQTDSYIGTGKDHFLYHDDVHGDFHVFPFDLNEALSESTTLDPWYNTTSTIKPAMSRTLVHADWRERYKAHYRTIFEETFNHAYLAPLIAHYHALIAPDVIADTKKLYTTQQFLNNLTQPVTIQIQIQNVTKPALLPWIQSRETWLRARPDFTPARTALSNLAHAPAAPNPLHQITVTATASVHATTMRLWYRPLGPFVSTTMFDDGLHGDGAAGDGVWGAFIPPQAAGARVDYYVEARTSSGLATFLPSGAEHRAPRFLVTWPVTPSPITLNEFVAQNVTGIVDENGQHEDWLELYNTSALPVSVGGLWVSDDISRPKWQIPGGTVIPGNGTLLIWCDEDGSQGPMHANFKLAAGGEAVALFAADRQSIHDWFEFGPQLADVSTARVLDGSLPWATFATPTPYLRNELAGCGQRTFGAPDPTSHGIALGLQGVAQLGATPSLLIGGAPVPGLAGILIAPMPGHVPLTPFGIPEVVMLDPASMFVVSTLLTSLPDPMAWPLPIPNDSQFIGARVYFQVLTLGGLGFDTSRALELVICP